MLTAAVHLSLHIADFALCYCCCLCQDVKATSAPNGACGFGPLSAAQYPGLNLAGVSFSSSSFSKYPLKACGVCLEIRCIDEVSQAPAHAMQIQMQVTIMSSPH
jgi:hypothetical protein